MTWRVRFCCVSSVAALILSGVTAPAAVPRASARPLRVMSISACTDQIVLALLPPQRIASVTWLARDPEISLMATAARRVPVNHGSSEEVLGQRPDLVIAQSYATPATRAMLKRIGWPLLEVGPAETIDQIRTATRQVARAVGEGAAGERLLARMDRQLAVLARERVSGLRVAAWDGGGFSAGAGSLYGLLITLAGATDVAAAAGERPGVPDIERLIALHPALLLGGGAYDQNDLRANVARSPLVRRIWGEKRTVAVHEASYICGTPFVADEAFKLRRKLEAAAGSAQQPLPSEIVIR